MSEIINLVIPTKIESLSFDEYGTSHFPTVAYTQTGEPLFDFGFEFPPEFGPSLYYLEFKESDFSEMLSLTTIQDCVAFEERQSPRCLLAWKKSPFEKHSLMTKTGCYERILKSVNELKSLIALRRILSSYQTDEVLTEHEIALMKLLIKERDDFPEEVFGPEEYVHCYNYLLTQNKDSDEYIFAHSAITSLSSKIQKYLDSFIHKAEVQFSFAKPLITIECPSAVVAMYIFYATSELNKDEYRQCNHKKCGAYYRVDKVHPQKFCDRHMTARRTKRKNAREKEKREAEEYL